MPTRMLAVGLSALIGAAMILVSPVPVKALSDTNVIAVYPNAVFMQDLDGLEVDDVVISELTGEARIIEEIVPSWLDCEGYCDDQNFSVDEGTRGFDVIYSGDDVYGWYTEDHWTIQPYECGELSIEVCPLIMDAPNAFPVESNIVFMPDATRLTVGEEVYSTVGAAFDVRTATVLAIHPTNDFVNSSTYALPAGPLKGSYVELSESFYPGPLQDHLFFSGAAKRTAVSFYPGNSHWNSRATYSIVRCTSGGDGMQTSTRMHKGCTLVRKWTGAPRAGELNFQRVVHTFTASDRAAGYLRFVVTIGRSSYYSPAYRVNE